MNSYPTLRRGTRSLESHTRHWATQVLSLCSNFDTDEINAAKTRVLQGIELLAQPQRIMAVGGAMCGKSSVLASLASMSVIATKKMEEQVYRRWRYLCPDGRSEASCFVARESLEGLELVDTLPLGSPEVENILTRLLPRVDILLAVVDMQQPEASPIWRFLEKQNQLNTLRDVIIVGTFCDQLSQEEQSKAGAKLTDICMERLSEQPQMIHLACTAGLTPSTASLVQLVQRFLIGSPMGLNGTIKQLLQDSYMLTEQCDRLIRERGIKLHDNRGLISHVEDEMEGFQKNQSRLVMQQAHKYALAAKDSLPELLRYVSGMLGFYLSPAVLFNLEVMGQVAENEYFCLVRDEIMAQQESADEQFVHYCGTHWNSTGPRLKQALDCELGEFPKEILEVELDNQRNMLSHTLYEIYIEAGLRHRFAQYFSRQSSWMHTSLVLVSLCLIAAGILGSLGQDFLGLCNLILATFIWIFSSIALIVVKRRITRGIAHEVNSIQPLLLTGLALPMQQAIQARTAMYRHFFTPARQQVASMETMLVPLNQSQRLIKQHLYGAIERLSQ